MREFKTLPQKYDKYLVLIGLFIPVPTSQCKYTPDFVIFEYGFASSIAVNKIPLMWIIILVAIIF